MIAMVFGCSLENLRLFVSGGGTMKDG